MNHDDPNCWTWDGYLGECVRHHQVPYVWWQHMNAYSVGAVVIATILAFALAILLVDWLTK